MFLTLSKRAEMATLSISIFISILVYSSVYTLARNFQCGEGKAAIKSIICLYMRHGRTEEHLGFFLLTKPMKDRCLVELQKNIEKVLQLQSSFSAKCLRQKKKT